MRYKVGDLVKVREWNDMADQYEVRDGVLGPQILVPNDVNKNCKAHFINSMKSYCGKTFRIYKVLPDDGLYQIEEMGYYLNDNMLENVYPVLTPNEVWKWVRVNYGNDKSMKETFGTCMDLFDLLSAFDFDEITDKVSAYVDKKSKEKASLLNVDMICVSDTLGFFTVGKKYTVTDGTFVDDDGTKRGMIFDYETVEDVNKHMDAQFIEYKG